MWQQREETAISSRFPFPLFCPVTWEGDYEKVGKPKKRSRKKQRGVGGEKSARKIENVSSVEAGRKLPMGLSAWKLTSNCL